MKKLLLGLVSFALIVSPLFINAEEKKAEKINISKYNTMNLVETLNDEEIKPEFSNYKESDDQITIYLFRGKGCGYCRAFLSFLNGITDEYGKYFKVVSFESWYDADNQALLDTISTFKGEAAQGVPYIIIGDQVFGGYTESYDDAIKEAITTLYDSKDRYDVFEEYNESIKFHFSDTSKIILWNLSFIIIGIIIIILHINSKFDKLQSYFENSKSYKSKQNITYEEEKTLKEIGKVVNNNYSNGKKKAYNKNNGRK